MVGALALLEAHRSAIQWGWGKRVAHLNRGSHSDWTCTMSRSSVRMGKLTAGRCFEGRSLMTGGFSGAASCLNGHEQAGHLRIL